MLEDDGTVRPHFNNNKNLVGLRLFKDFNYYKAFHFERIFNENDDFMTKDMESILDDVFGVESILRTMLVYEESLKTIQSLIQEIEGSIDVRVFAETVNLRDKIVVSSFKNEIAYE